MNYMVDVLELQLPTDPKCFSAMFVGRQEAVAYAGFYHGGVL